RVRTAAIRLIDRREGVSDDVIWPGSGGGVNQRLMLADFKMIADQGLWLHPGDDESSIHDAAFEWIEAFRDDVRYFESQRAYVPVVDGAAVPVESEPFITLTVEEFPIYERWIASDASGSWHRYAKKSDAATAAEAAKAMFHADEIISIEDHGETATVMIRETVNQPSKKHQPTEETMTTTRRL